MKRVFLQTICFVLFFIATNAQTKTEERYIERAAEVQEEVWNNADDAFKVKDIPAKYKNESAVIIAKSYEVSNSTKRKIKVITIFGATIKEYKYLTTYRERVLIQDKSALEDYSTINYKKITDKTFDAGIMKLVNTTKTYIGLKVYKPNGKEVDINPSEEEVLTKNENKDKEGKLAVPDLQMGDIIDYYIRIEEVIQDLTEVKGPDVFFLGSEYPMLFYKVKYTLDKKCGADILNLNGAKPMTQIINKEDDIILEFTERDIAPYKSTYWTSAARQIPYYVVRYGFPGASIVAGKGEVKRGPFTQKYAWEIQSLFSTIVLYNYFDMAPKKYVESHFANLKSKDIPDDSIVNCLYNYFKWDQYKGFEDVDVSNKKNYRTTNWLDRTSKFNQMLHYFDIKNEIIFVCNRFSNRLSDVFSRNNIQTFIKINSNGNLKWVCFSDMFQDIGQPDKDFQGEDAQIIIRKGKNTFKETEPLIKLPIANSQENVSAEKLNVGFNKGNFQLVTIDRFCSETGFMKQDDQKKLMLAEDVQAELAALIEMKKNADLLLENKKSHDKGLEVRAAMDKERLKQEGYFKEDIKSQYDQEPKEMKSFSIINSGLNIKKPAFEYTENFTMENFVKKAGNNFIFDIGKLMGTYTKTDDKLRNRTLDIYMPCARTFTYSITVTLPDGYKATGIENINKKVENECASFASVAAITGNVVTLNITRTFKNNFEPASNWPKLLAVMDASSDFTNSKLLLEKIK